MILALEPRVMFDGAMAGEITGNLGEPENSIFSVISLDENQNYKEIQKPYEVAVIDTSIKNYQTIISSIGADADIVILEKDAVLGDIPQLLSDHKNIDALHIYSHGGIGVLKIGSGSYDKTNIHESAETFSNIGAKLKQTGDILLYGCNIAANGEGESFINLISEMASADVAASDDITGDRRLGGDWKLEYRSGIVEAREREAHVSTGILAAPELSTSGSSILTGGGGNAYGTSNFSTILESAY